jgi:hypothetical protein
MDNKLQIQYNLHPATLERWEQIKTVMPYKFSQATALRCVDMVAIWPQIKPATFDDAIKADTPTLGALGFYLGGEQAVQLIAEMITAAAILLNVGKNLQKHQLEPIAEVLYTEFKLLTVADFRCALRMGASGKFGQVFDRLDLEVLSSWCAQYWSQKADYCEGMNTRKHKENKQPPSNAIAMPDFFRDWLKERETGKQRERANFEPDDALLKQWEKEWEAIDDELRPEFALYVKLKTQMLFKSQFK